MQGQHPDIHNNRYIPYPVTDPVLPEQNQQEKVVYDKYRDRHKGPGSFPDESLGIHHPDQGKYQSNQQPPEPHGDPFPPDSPIPVKVLKDFRICRQGFFHRVEQLITGHQNINKLDRLILSYKNHTVNYC
jgi:hypothetical protein